MTRAPRPSWPYLEAEKGRQNQPSFFQKQKKPTVLPCSRVESIRILH